MPALISLVYAADLGNASIAPTNFPRLDLVATFLTGIKTNLGPGGAPFNLNQPANA